MKKYIATAAIVVLLGSFSASAMAKPSSWQTHAPREGASCLVVCQQSNPRQGQAGALTSWSPPYAGAGRLCSCSMEYTAGTPLGGIAGTVAAEGANAPAVLSINNGVVAPIAATATKADKLGVQ